MVNPGFHALSGLLSLNLLVWSLAPGSWRYYLGVPALVLLLLWLNFHRDPERCVPVHDGTFVVSPADGTVVLCDRDAARTSISIFLSAFDVHINRAPAAGRVVALKHRPGKYLPAFLSRSASCNEREILELDSPEAGRIVCTQVAGLLARRIDNWVAPGDVLRQGERYGMIRLGSRLDIELAPEFVPLVRRGMHVKGGATLLAEVRRG